MGKKQPLTAAQKQRPGLDITRFLERKNAQAGSHGSSPTGNNISGVRRPARGRASTPGGHCLDNVLLSQDADDGGMQVVWASSPTATFSPQKGTGVSQEAATTSQPAGNSQSSKDGLRRNLIEAVQQATSDTAERHASERMQTEGPCSDVLNLAERRDSHRAASTSAPLDCAVPKSQLLPRVLPRRQPELASQQVKGLPTLEGATGLPAGHSDEQVMQEVLAATDTYDTPAAARHGRAYTGPQSADRARAPQCTPALLMLGGKRPLGASGKKPASNNKRRALLDLLDQVELMVKQRGQSEENPSVQQDPGASSAVAVPEIGAPDRHRDWTPVQRTPLIPPQAMDAQIAQPEARTGAVACGIRPTVKCNTATPHTTVQPVLSMGVNSEAAAGSHETGWLPSGVRPTQPISADLAPAALGAASEPSAVAGPSNTPAYGVCHASTLASRTPPPAMDTLAARAPERAVSCASTQPVPLPSSGTGAGQRAAPASATSAAMPSSLVVGTADDDDDDDLWGDVDVDALVANATLKQNSPPNAHAGGACVGGAPGPLMQLPATQHAGQQRAQMIAVPHSGHAQLPSERLQAQALGAAQPADASHATGAGAACQGAGGIGALQDAPLLGERDKVHFVVLEVDESPHVHAKTLRCFNEYKGCEVYVHLRDVWADQAVQPGDTVNVVGGRVLPDPQCTRIEVSSQEGLLILHPDILLSGTTVCTAIRCTRQAWLQERMSGGSAGERALVGNMMHELLQRSLQAALFGRIEKDAILAEARKIVRGSAGQVLESQHNEESMLANITQQVDSLVSWCSTYVTPNQAAPQGGRIDPASAEQPTTYCRVTEVLDIEESIWAPKYGLKGQLDASLRVTMSVKDLMHNQRTLQETYAGASSQRSGLEPQRFHGRRHSSADARGLGPSGTPATALGVKGPAVSGVMHGQGRPQQQHAWSIGAAPPRPSVPFASQQAAHVAPLPSGPPDTSSNSLIVPFEFKSGKDRQEHRAQVLMYLLLMEERYETTVRTGLLWNSSKPTMQAVRYAHHELAALIMHRNRLAAHLVGAAREPPPPVQGYDAERKCDYCGVRAACALYLSASSRGDSRDGRQQQERGSQLPDMDLHPVLREKLSGIAPSSADFFAHWVRLVDLEEEAARADKAGIWAMSGPQREQQGSCIAQLLFEEQLPRAHDSDGAPYRYMFRRAQPAARDPSQATAGGNYVAAAAPEEAPSGADESDADGAGGLLSAGFEVGQQAILGVEGRHAAAARVTVSEVTKDTIVLDCSKEIKIAKLQGEHSAGGKAGIRGSPASGPINAQGAKPVTWRLDKEEWASGYAQARFNLAMLCGALPEWQSSGSGGSKGGGAESASQARREGQVMQLRKLIIDLEPPQQGLALNGFSASQLSGSAASSQLQASAYLRENSHRMNGEQLEAVQRVLAMQDYAILLGMPGTGKTTTIVHIIRALAEARVSVLVASYTNSAVDNILLKLIGTSVSFVRLGSVQGVHPVVRPYMPGGEHHPDDSVAGLHDLMARVHVVGCTCRSMNSPLLAGRTFGVCILDEASQVTLPASLAPLAMARSFLLVGDHYQLSPLVKSREAAQGGLGVSLFRRLSEAHPQAVVTLRSQYRMAADIMELSNTLVYNGRMLCGSDAVANAKLHLSHMARLASFGRSATAPAPTDNGSWPANIPVPGWVMAALEPDSRVLFLDTDGVPGCREVSVQDGSVNPGEVRIIYALVAALEAAGLPLGDIGVASQYKAQVAALLQALTRLHRDGDPCPAAAVEAGKGKKEPLNGGDTVEVLTVDKYQGRDKSAILLSFTRCNSNRSAGRLLADWQRLNVAITRARTKLLLVGSAATLESIPMLRDMMSLLRSKRWVVQLPADCLGTLPQVPKAAGSVPRVVAGPEV